MLELPEVLTIAQQLKNNIMGKKVKRVLPPSKVHKFCWYNGEVAEYENLIMGCKVTSAEGFGIFVEIGFDNGYKLCFNDGVNARIAKDDDTPKNYQLIIKFDDTSNLVFTVAMYGGIILHNDKYDNEYYLKSRGAVSPLSETFREYYYKMFEESKPNLSAKAFLAAEQRFPGIGNGVLQDILFVSGIHPKRKINTLNNAERDTLFKSIVEVVNEMIVCGGRDTEKDIFGQKGGYNVKMSKNTVGCCCTNCKDTIIKETYMGGSVYYCPSCQPLIKG